MLNVANISFYTRKIFIIFVLTGLTVISFGSIGGGGSKSKSLIKSDFIPLRTSRGFTLKAGPNYRGSMIVKEERTTHYISYNSLVTYQKGNSTYILPNKYRIYLSPNNSKNSLQMVNLRIKLCK
jgi:hypothetical protein